jgi:chemotaxis protein CheD
MRSIRSIELLESDKGLDELLYSLKKRGVLFNSKNRPRVVHRIGIIAVKLGFKDYMTLLKHLEVYPEDWVEIISWLKKGKVYNSLEKNFSPLVTVNTILENASNSKKSAIKRKSIVFKHQTHNISQAYSEISKNNLAGHTERFVGIAEIAIGHSGDLLKITALGSCIGLVIYPTSIDDINQRCAVLGHIMLSHSPEKPDTEKRDIGPAKYADKAIPTMISILEELGFHKKHLEAKMVGGARMFGSSVFSGNIGKSNAETTREMLKKLDIPITAYFTGGDTGMSVIFSVNDYKLIVKPTGGSQIVL